MSFFGVYDGHGGAEVAIYLSRHLPEFLKKTKEYQDMDRESIKKALHTAFVSIDKSIKSKEVLEEIQAIAKGSNENKGEEAPTLGLDYEEENVSELYEEGIVIIALQSCLYAKFVTYILNSILYMPNLSYNAAGITSCEIPSCERDAWWNL